jgi:hypothetical protein
MQKRPFLFLFMRGIKGHRELFLIEFQAQSLGRGQESHFLDPTSPRREASLLNLSVAERRRFFYFKGSVPSDKIVMYSV